MKKYASCGCREYRALNRRQFLAGTAVTAGAVSLLPAWLPQVALAQDHTSGRDILVSVFLRGGADGLTLCVPFGDPAYYAAGVRPTLAVPRPDSKDPNAALDLNGFFGLPKAMAPLRDIYQAGHLLLVHACGSKDGTRSHFDAQRFMEAGKPNDPTLYTGWLGRHLASVPPLRGDAPLRAISLDDALPLTMVGASPALPIPDPGSFDIAGNPDTLERRDGWLRAAYERAGDPLRAAALNTENTIGLLKRIDFAGYKPGGGAAYPDTDFGRAMKATAALIKAEVGVEAIHVNLGGWDTHDAQAPFTPDGAMWQAMQEFAKGLAAFHADLFAGRVTNVTLVALSEFGRTVSENASRGTDHGHGNVMFVLSGAVNPQVYASWPGIDPDHQFEGQDLDVTTDYRDVLSEVIQKRLGNPNLAAVFPDYTPTVLNLIR